MYGASDQLIAALHTSHTVELRATWESPGGILPASEPRILGGSVTRTKAGRIGSGQATLEIAETSTEALVSLLDDLSPGGLRLRLERGASWLDEYGATVSELAPIFSGFIVASSVTSAPGGVKLDVTLEDAYRYLADAVVPGPVRYPPGTLIRDAVDDLFLRAGLTDVVTVIYDGVFPQAFAMARVFATTGSQPLLEILEPCLRSMGAELIVERDGTLRIREPMEAAEAPTSWVYEAGELVTAITGQVSRDQLYNGVIVTTTHPKLGSALSVAVWDYADPDSPLHPDHFGRRPRVFATNALNDLASLQKAAQNFLRRLARDVATLTIEAVPNPLLDPGDVIVVEAPHLGLTMDRRWEILSIEMPLDVATPMRMECRAVRRRTTT